MGNRFQNQSYYLFRFRDEIYNLCATTDESDLNDRTAQNLDVVCCYLPLV